MVLRHTKHFIGVNIKKKYVIVSFVGFWSSISIGTLAQVFSCEFCETSKNTFSYRTPPVAACDISIVENWSRLLVTICFQYMAYTWLFHVYCVNVILQVLTSLLFKSINSNFQCTFLRIILKMDDIHSLNLTQEEMIKRPPISSRFCIKTSLIEKSGSKTLWNLTVNYLI